MSTSVGVKVDLTDEEIRYVRRSLRREPNEVEWGMFDTMFSEHICYKSSRPVIKLLPTTSARVIIGPGYDAGVVDIGDGLAATLKIESHNHPSAIDPYNGAGTGIGGVLRDVLSMGTRPIALMDPLRFGSITSARSRWLLKYVVKGIADYGNSVGVPTVTGEVEFDPSFEMNCLVCVGCVGIAKRDRIIAGGARFPGDIVILAGGSTGRDGLHGVTFASRVLSGESDVDRPAVQVGDPFLKNIIIEATLAAIETNHVRGLKDLGGGGLTCGAIEIAADGGTGIEIDLSKVRLRESGMTPYEIMLSESQERMLFVVEPSGVEEVLRVFDKYELPYSIIGRVTETRNVVVKVDDRIVADLPAELAAKAPIAKREAKKPDNLSQIGKARKPEPPTDLSETLIKLLSSPNVASKEWIYRQYDFEVGVRTVLKLGQADAAVLRLIGTNKGLAVKADGNSRRTSLDPYNGGASALAEACRNVAAVGAEPIAMVDHCNFGNPERPDVFWQFREAVRGMADACKALGVPCIGGKVSFYNEDSATGKAVKPSPVVAVLGLIEDVRHLATIPFKEHGDSIYIVGKTRRELGGSEYYNWIHNITGGEPPKFFGSEERRSMMLAYKSICQGLTETVHDCSDGGLAVAVGEMCVLSGLGAEIDLPEVPGDKMQRDELLFSESNSRFIMTISRKNLDEFLSLASNLGARVAEVGKVTDTGELMMSDKKEKVLTCGVEPMRKAWFESIGGSIGGV
ncbi:MAG: phosphoribosylformylglycinamidine synthase subunit PurL [Promethearchaeati archaeon SRVP18_Atabeyarchaeia-1]